MKSFRLDVGRRRRLTAAGWLVLLISATTTAALGLAGGNWRVLRLGPGEGALYPFLVVGCGVGCGLAVWSAGAGLCGLAGLPLFTPGDDGWSGTLGLPRKRSRRPIQFTLGRLQSVVLLVAVLCALTRLDDLQIGNVVYLVLVLTFITYGTAGVVLQRGPASLRVGMVRGGLAGACLSAVCPGWMAVIFLVIEPGIRPLLVLASITVLGGLLGVLIGLATVVWQRRRSGGRRKAFIHRPHGS